MTRPRPYDVLLYGATGFVGAQTVAYFAEHAGGLRWALGGRDAARLEAVRAQAGPGAAQAGIVVADAQDARALRTLARKTRVVLSTAGPFALHGSTLVAACVEQRTHYVDITGETPWVRGLIDRHHTEAAAGGTRIIPGCGFDSVPSDLGAWLVAQALWQAHGEPCTSVKAVFSLRGGLNGGTFASMMQVLDSGQQDLVADPFLLNPPGTAPDDVQPHADPHAPHRDADFDAWLGPFFMGPINTRVVRRSVALMAAPSPFAADFHYQEYLRFGRGPVAALAAAGFSIGAVAGQQAMGFGVVRRLAQAVAPAPGQGPSQATMDGGSFRCELLGRSAGGHEQRGCIAGQGDPGNRATTRFVCEAALALALQADALPGGSGRGGVLTPASGLGEVLARRLQAAGMTVAPLPAGRNN
ncbi:saccharopine dehydrogenase family protein [Aquabacterium sp.]|uniref:saccharopine dehydrogenase family protein n=1 Tax=Aquabacterium sp. TaxID=1872578 RepID=UPI002C4110E4|nr:saccharopine dehydrogenase NADP-binding domain-containing protein [Aquabacterium sp.]HSW07641.1 saccharopine dehydrogenase NADP-binding domain-containing protein [Aquabacterium sp.]